MSSNVVQIPARREWRLDRYIIVSERGGMWWELHEADDKGRTWMALGPCHVEGDTLILGPADAGCPSSRVDWRRLPEWHKTTYYHERIESPKTVPAHVEDPPF